MQGIPRSQSEAAQTYENCLPTQCPINDSAFLDRAVLSTTEVVHTLRVSRASLEARRKYKATFVSEGTSHSHPHSHVQRDNSPDSPCCCACWRCVGSVEIGTQFRLEVILG